MVAGCVHINGEFVELEDAKISIFDTGFLHSDVVYDVTTAWQGYIFKLDEHLERFAASCAGFRLTNPYSDAETANILAETTRRAECEDGAFIHMHVTRGEYAENSRDPRLCENQFACYVVPFVWLWGEEKSKAGINIHMAGIERISSKAVDARFKNFHWGDLIQAQYEAYENERDDAALCAADGSLAEGPGFNIWVVKDGVCATPDKNCLLGMSRKSVIELCGMENIPFELRTVHPDELRNADEAFATSSAGGVMPITRVDDKPLGNGAPGILTSQLFDSYWRQREAGWCGTKITDILDS
ncbi:MAG: branched-chain amino acid transferase [Rhodospirillaceae bacterium]|jgi:branched-chain amino acid aminotransferase|nr:branched-chain amino acid transferase [Rhodospirillaceae bacterium]